MKKISRTNLIILALVLTAVWIFDVPRFVFQTKKAKVTEEEKKAQIYYCPMHPTYVSDRPGDCPICYMKLVPKPKAKEKKERKILYYRHPMGLPDTSPVPKKDSMGMDYVPVYEDELGGPPSEVPGHTTIQIPLAKQQLMGITLGTVEKRRLVKEIRTVGRVVFDPELFTAQQEFISALEGAKRRQDVPYHEPIERVQALVESTKLRLRLLGMSEEEIAELEKQSSQDLNLILPGSAAAQQGTVWVYGNIYEYELPFVKIGTPVKIRVPTFPDREFTGEVRALDPVLDQTTRSIRIRARVNDPEGLLRPQMYVDIYLESDLGEPLSVPEEAVLPTGERNLVFVAQGDGFFQPREVKLGAKAGNFYEVTTGLEAGERIATSGNFLIDSESRLQGALESFTAGTPGQGGTHSHGE